MHCEKVRLPDGSVVLICGRRPSKSKHPASEENLTMATDEQKLLIETARKACSRAHEEAAKCDRAGLPILAREWDYTAKELEQRIDLQERALQQGSLFTSAHAGAASSEQ
jgi:hypothetical protein